MLTYEQYRALLESSGTVDRLYDEIDLDDDKQTEIEVDPGELYQLIETWSFMYEALRSTGMFNRVQTPASLPRAGRNR